MENFLFLVLKLTDKYSASAGSNSCLIGVQLPYVCTGVTARDHVNSNINLELGLVENFLFLVIKLTDKYSASAGSNS